MSCKTSIKTEYMSGKDATLALKTEPWIVNTVSSLPMVHSYQKITFGDSAKLKSSKNKIRTTSCVTKNYCSDSDSFSKWYMEGSVANVVCQLLSMDEAD